MSQISTCLVKNTHDDLNKTDVKLVEKEANKMQIRIEKILMNESNRTSLFRKRLESMKDSRFTFNYHQFGH